MYSRGKGALNKSSASNHWNELVIGLDSIELTFGAVT